MADDIPDGACGPEEVAVAADEAQSLQRLLACLPADQRGVVELRLAGLAGAEIAAAQRRSLGSVKMLQFRVMAHLRACMGAGTPLEKSDDDEA